MEYEKKKMYMRKRWMRKKEKRKEREKRRGGGLENLRSTACTLRMYASLNSNAATSPFQNVFCPVILYQFAAVNVFRRR